MTPSPASTVVLVRNAGGDIETLLLLRNSKLVFEGGTWVFPGGKIEAFDYPGGRSLVDHHGQLRAARRAAVRETEEEAGVSLQAEELIHIAHWTTPEGPPRRYATWFFVCPLREAVSITVDQDEILDHCWLTPRQALRDCREGLIRLPLPTRETLASISGFRDVDELCTAMREAEVLVFPEDSSHYQPEPAGG